MIGDCLISVYISKFLESCEDIEMMARERLRSGLRRIAESCAAVAEYD
jgi:hypothetical protein